jgi:hypothetical protein
MGAPGPFDRPAPPTRRLRHPAMSVPAPGPPRSRGPRFVRPEVRKFVRPCVRKFVRPEVRTSGPRHQDGPRTGPSARGPVGRAEQRRGPTPAPSHATRAVARTGVVRTPNTPAPPGCSDPASTPTPPLASPGPSTAGACPGSPRSGRTPANRAAHDGRSWRGSPGHGSHDGLGRRQRPRDARLFRDSGQPARANEAAAPGGTPGPDVGSAGSDPRPLGPSCSGPGLRCRVSGRRSRDGVGEAGARPGPPGVRQGPGPARSTPPVALSVRAAASAPAVRLPGRCFRVRGRRLGLRAGGGCAPGSRCAGCVGEGAGRPWPRDGVRRRARVR